MLTWFRAISGHPESAVYTCAILATSTPGDLLRIGAPRLNVALRAARRYPDRGNGSRGATGRAVPCLRLPRPFPDGRVDHLAKTIFS